MASALTQFKVESYRLALEKMTGVKPDVGYRADGSAVVYWPPEKAVKLRAWLNNQLSRTPAKSEIDFQLEPAIRPLYIKKIAPYVAAIFGAGIIAGVIARGYL